MNLSFEDDDSLPPSPKRTTLNGRRLSVAGPGLGSFATLRMKAEDTRDEVEYEITELLANRLKIRNFFGSGEKRPFIDSLYALEHLLGTTAEDSRSDERFFHGIDQIRLRLTWDQVCLALQGLAQVLSRMARECGANKAIRVCRRFVVGALRRLAFHFGKLAAGIEGLLKSSPKRWIRCGEEMNTAYMLEARIEDWLDVKARYLDRILCKKPDHVLRRGQKKEGLRLGFTYSTTSTTGRSIKTSDPR